MRRGALARISGANRLRRPAAVVGRALVVIMRAVRIVAHEWPVFGALGPSTMAHAARMPVTVGVPIAPRPIPADKHVVLI